MFLLGEAAPFRVRQSIVLTPPRLPGSSLQAPATIFPGIADPQRLGKRELVPPTSGKPTEVVAVGMEKPTMLPALSISTAWLLSFGGEHSAQLTVGVLDYHRICRRGVGDRNAEAVSEVNVGLDDAKLVYVHASARQGHGASGDLSDGRNTFAKPIPLPKGTRVLAISHFDNSANNKFNPDPSKEVRWGLQNWDEMSNAFVGSIFGVHDAKLFRRSGPSLLPAGPVGPILAALAALR